jgi:protein-S-isoprenylcysteine O-methyltransferase Ste14
MKISTVLRVLAMLVIAATACWLSGVQLVLRSLLLVPAFVGLTMALWAYKLNPEGGKVGPAPTPSTPIRTGPYRLMHHPMYVGQFFAIAFFTWYSAGFWAAFAVALFAEIVFREFMWREAGSPPQKENPRRAPAAAAEREAPQSLRGQSAG